MSTWWMSYGYLGVLAVVVVAMTLITLWHSDRMAGRVGWVLLLVGGGIWLGQALPAAERGEVQIAQRAGPYCEMLQGHIQSLKPHQPIGQGVSPIIRFLTHQSSDISATWLLSRDQAVEAAMGACYETTGWKGFNQSARTPREALTQL